MSKGCIGFVLHFHLPWVLGHGKWPHGEDWLNEAAVECYIPLLQVFTRLAESGVRNCITIGITPVLTEQLASPAFCDEVGAYIDRKIAAAIKDEEQFEKEESGDLISLARGWREFFEGIKKYFHEEIGGDIVGTFRALQEDGVIEIITSAATHGYLPLLAEDGAIVGQVQTGVESYKHRYGRMPRGFWLPECAYRPRSEHWLEPVGVNKRVRERAGIEKFLLNSKIEYTLVDTHMIKRGTWHGPATRPFFRKGLSGDPFRHRAEGLPAPLPRIGIPPPFENGRSPYRPYEIASQGEDSGAGAAIFVRDPQTSLQVWSGTYGYPGDGRYLEFHKKHWPGGHKYWRVTDPKADLGDKQVYNSARAEDAIKSHADHFVGLVKEAAKAAAKEADTVPIIVCPFDAELFGHWWFEGPRWLEAVLKAFAADDAIESTTLGNYLDRYPPTHSLSLPEGSWGDGGDFRVWLNEDTAWTWENVYAIEGLVKSLAQKAPPGNDEFDRVMRQLARELLILEASDWQFLITTGTARDYAEKRLHNHFEDSKKLARIAESILACGKMNAEDESDLDEIEKRDYCFRNISVSWWK